MGNFSSFSLSLPGRSTVSRFIKIHPVEPRFIGPPAIYCLAQTVTMNLDNALLKYAFDDYCTGDLGC
jgi:hypothetical protein